MLDNICSFQQISETKGVEVLLQFGADLSMKNEHGELAKDLVPKRRRRETMISDREFIDLIESYEFPIKEPV